MATTDASASTHQKGIVQGGSPAEIADAILAEHEEDLRGWGDRVKADDELCRVCALAQLIKQESARVDALAQALRMVLEFGGFGPGLVVDEFHAKYGWSDEKHAEEMIRAALVETETDDTEDGCPICDGGSGTPCNSHFGV